MVEGVAEEAGSVSSLSWPLESPSSKKKLSSAEGPVLLLGSSGACACAECVASDLGARHSEWQNLKDPVSRSTLNILSCCTTSLVILNTKPFLPSSDQNISSYNSFPFKSIEYWGIISTSAAWKTGLVLHLEARCKSSVLHVCGCSNVSVRVSIHLFSGYLVMMIGAFLYSLSVCDFVIIDLCN